MSFLPKTAVQGVRRKIATLAWHGFPNKKANLVRQHQQQVYSGADVSGAQEVWGGGGEGVALSIFVSCYSLMIQSASQLDRGCWHPTALRLSQTRHQCA